ncbi:MAG: VWA domain-containing protein [Bryobacteraceae bacterium]
MSAYASWALGKRDWTKRGRRAVLLATAFAFFRTGVWAAQLSPDQPARAGDAFRIVSDTSLVLVDVAVKDTKGGFVRGLSKEKFSIAEAGGKPRPVTSFSTGEQPITIGLVVDRSGSMRDKWQEVTLSAIRLALSGNKNDEFYVVTFADDAALNLPPRMPFTDNAEALRRALVDISFGGRTALYDGLTKALEHLKDGRHERKAIVLMSDGGDNASSATREAVLEAAESSLATIYTIGIFDESDEDARPRFLKRLARVTGGEAFFPTQWDQLPALAAQVAADIRSRYTLGFSPADDRMDNSVRKFKISVAGSRGRWKVRSRTHYVASSQNGVATGRVVR